MTMIARPVGSLCTHNPDLPWVVECVGSGPFLFWTNMFASCKKQLSRYSCASLVPLGIKWACICAEKKNVLGGVVSVLCVFVRVAM